MPPKPLAEQLARKKAEKDKGGWGWAGNLVGDLVDMAKNPVDTAKTLGSMAKDTFIDPVLDLPEAFRPGSGLSPAERVATGIGGGLAIADVVTPLVPEGAFANSAQRALAKRMADASNSGRQYRGVLGVHGSPTKGLTSIEPRTNYNLPGKDNIAWFWDVERSGYDPEGIAGRALGFAGNEGEIYVGRFPRRSVGTPREYVLGDPAVPNYSTEAGQVIGSMPRRVAGARDIERELAQTLRNAPLRPSERRRLELAIAMNPDIDPSNPYGQLLKGLSEDEYNQAMMMPRGTPIAEIKAAAAGNQQALEDIAEIFRDRLYNELGQRVVRKRRGWPDMGPDGDAIIS